MRRAAYLVEDGLRTATLADSGRGLVIVRSLALGCIDPRDPPAALSRRIEERWKEAGRVTVDAAHAGAHHAGAVRFESKEQAFAIYVTERLAGAAPDGWYWKRILPPGAEDLPIGDLFTALALALAEPPEAAAARIAAFVEHIESRGALLPLAEAIDDRCAAPVLPVLLPGVRMEPAPVAAVPRARTRPARPAPAAAQSDMDDEPRFEKQSLVAPPFRAVLQSLARRASHRRAAALFAAIAILRERPWLAAAPEALARRVRAIIAQASMWEDASPAESSLTASEAPVVHGATETDQRHGERGASAEPVHSPSAARSPVTAAPTVAERRPATADEHVQPATPADTAARGEISSCAGVFFLLPAIERLGFEKFAAEHPLLFEMGLLPALLRDLACRAGATENDPVLAALDYTPPDDPAPEFLAAIAGWRRRVHRCVRREAKLLVRWIVRRRGCVSFTRTHIDVYFDLAQADVRIRRLGLDIDPGWVPALGKVIAFHYGRDES